MHWVEDRLVNGAMNENIKHDTLFRLENVVMSSNESVVYNQMKFNVKWTECV